MKKTVVVVLALFLMSSAFARTTLSVLYFANTAKNKQFGWLCRGIADVLNTDLAHSPKLIIVERENLDKIMKEQQLQLAGVTGDKNAVEIGELLQAQKLLYGSFIVNGARLRIDGKLCDVESGQIEKGFSVTGRSDDALKLLELFSVKVRRQMGLKVSSNIHLLKPKAVKSYYEGMEMIDRKRYPDALKKFKESQEEDPLYPNAQEGLEKAYLFLKNFKKRLQQRKLNELYQTAEAIRQRLYENPFRSYKEIREEFKKNNISDKEAKAFQQSVRFYMMAGTKDELVCLLSAVYLSIANQYEDFYDSKSAHAVHGEAYQMSEYWLPKMKSKHFKRQLLYQEILFLEQMRDYTRLKKAAETFMTEFPDDFMIEAVEDSYETALEGLKEERKH